MSEVSLTRILGKKNLQLVYALIEYIEFFFFSHSYLTRRAAV